MSSDAGGPGGRGSETTGDAGHEAPSQPEGLRTDASGGRDGASGPSTPPTAPPADGSTDVDGFGARGWVLVGVVVLSTVVVPGLVYAFPALPADAGLPFLVAMLVLPLLPAVLLGAAAVWSMSAAAESADDRD